MPADSITAPPFGRMLTAMVTPFNSDGSLDAVGVGDLATYLVAQGNDGLIVNGTTGESPTTTDAEKEAVVRAVAEAVGDRAHVVAGVGSNDTAHTLELARAAEKAGASALLVVSPYYNKPPQAGLVEHFQQIADATELSLMLYDIPARTGVPIKTETLVRLAEHPKIVAVKDAKDDLAASSEVLARTDLAYYSGTDILTLPLLSVGAVGVVSVVSHVVTPQLVQMISAFVAGDVAGARSIHQQLLPVFEGVFRSQGAILIKAALSLLALPVGPVRLPLVDATADEVVQLRADLAAGGVLTP